MGMWCARYWRDRCRNLRIAQNADNHVCKIAGMIRTEPLDRTDWTAAMSLALARVPPEDRPGRVASALTLLANGTLDASAIQVARDDEGTIAGVQICVPLAGASCLFWLPTAPDEIASALVEASLAMCRTRGIKIAQVFADADELPLTAPLLRQGFRHVTRIHQLQHVLGDLPPSSASPLRFVTFQTSHYRDFTDVLGRTYEGTLDCPELNGRRTIDEIIAGHQAEGKFDPARWWLAFLDAQPVGVMLQPIKLTGAVERLKKKSYIRAPKYPQPTFDATFQAKKADPSWRTYEVPCGHDVMVDMPERLAEILLDVA